MTGVAADRFPSDSAVRERTCTRTTSIVSQPVSLIIERSFVDCPRDAAR